MTTCVVPAQLNFTVVCGWWKHKVLFSWISWAFLPAPPLLVSRGYSTLQYLHVFNKTPMFALVSLSDMYFCYTHTKGRISLY